MNKPFIHIELNEKNELSIETNVGSAAAITLLARTTEEIAFSIVREQAEEHEEADKESTVQ